MYTYFIALHSSPSGAVPPHMNMNKNGSFSSYQTRKSNDQCVLWYSFRKFLLFCYTGLYYKTTVKFSLKSVYLIYACLQHGVQIYLQINGIPDVINNFFKRELLFVLSYTPLIYVGQTHGILTWQPSSSFDKVSGIFKLWRCHAS